MEKREKLIIDLKRIRDNDYRLEEGEKIQDYLEYMKEHIGDLDPELRDKLICRTFIYWIERHKYFSKSELRELLWEMLSEEFTFFKIENSKDEFALKRSFSVLLVNPILCYHMEDNFLQEEEIIKVKEKLVKYYQEEKNYTGRHEEYGWIDAFSHCADGFDILVNCKGLVEDDYKEILDAFKGVLISNKALSAEEYERMINVIFFNYVEDELVPIDYLCEWIESMECVLECQDKVERFFSTMNVKNFIRSLYFRCIHIEENERVMKSIINLERKVNEYLE